MNAFADVFSRNFIVHGAGNKWNIVNNICSAFLFEIFLVNIW